MLRSIITAHFPVFGDQFNLYDLSVLTTVCLNLHTIDLGGETSHFMMYANNNQNIVLTDENKAVVEQLLYCIADCAPNLTTLSLLNNIAVENDSLIYLVSKCTNITHLCIAYCIQLTSVTMDAIATHLPQLINLDILGDNIANIINIRKLLISHPNLIKLNWSYFTKTKPTTKLNALRLEYPKLQISTSKGYQ